MKKKIYLLIRIRILIIIFNKMKKLWMQKINLIKKNFILDNQLMQISHKVKK